MELVDGAGRPVAGSLTESVIGREATPDLSRELYDTRPAPSASAVLRHAWTVTRPGLVLRARVVVEPDHFSTKFFRAPIPGARRGRAQLQEALRQAERSAFTIFAKEVPL